MIKIESSRVKTTSEVYDAMSRMGESVKRANPKERYESVSSVEVKTVSKLREGSGCCLRLAYDVG